MTDLPPTDTPPADPPPSNLPPTDAPPSESPPADPPPSDLPPTDAPPIEPPPADPTPWRRAAGPARPPFRAVPLRLLIPNLVTLLALCLGLTAIRFAFEGAIEWAVSAIAAAAVLDGLDGRIARALKGTSRFGAELDSLADFVDFGVAPGVVLYVAGLDAVKSLGWLTVLVFAIACALRLARFNVTLEDPSMAAWRKNFFVGMPAPAGAIVGLLPVYLRLLLTDASSAPRFVGVEIAYVLVVALLMASRVPHFSGKSIGRVPQVYVAPVLIGLAAALLLIVNFPLQSLVALSVAYLAAIPWSVRRYLATARDNG